MELKKIAKIQSGYITRGKIEPHEQGSHLLLQARDVDAERLAYQTDGFVRLNPNLSRNDWLLEPQDILFNARGTRNYSILIHEIPEYTLAAASFFIIRVTNHAVRPDYLFWYLNQPPVAYYLEQHSGRGVHMPVVRRSALESIQIQIPPLAVQEKIAALNDLLGNEISMLEKLAEKRRKMITAACLRAVRENT